jgi:hypothetical protein
MRFSGKALRNIAIIAVVALAVVVVPGGGETADTIVAVISLAFLAAIAWLVQRLYVEHQFTLLSLSTTLRALLYGAVAVAFMTLVATDRLWDSGAGTLAWFALLGGAGFAVYYVWMQSRRYNF